jgi:hypothetical protein
MTSYYNNFYGPSFNQISRYEDVKEYAAVQITAIGAVSGSITLNWSLDETGSVVATNSLDVSLGPNQSITKQYPVIAPFLLLVKVPSVPLVGDASGKIITNYKKNLTEVELHDSRDQSLSIQLGDENSIKTRFMDSFGFPISNTGSLSPGNALLVHPDINTNQNTLIVALNDSCNNPINGHNGSLVILASDLSGSLQAGTQAISDTSYTALYHSLTDSCGFSISSTLSYLTPIQPNNAAFITLANSGGPIRENNEIYVEYDDTESYKSPALTLEVSGQYISSSDISSGRIALIHLGLVNETAQTRWLKVYDICSSLVNTEPDNNATSPFVIINCPVPAYQQRDLDLGNGVKFENGIYFRNTDNYQYSASGASDIIYVNATYRNL